MHRFVRNVFRPRRTFRWISKVSRVACFRRPTHGSHVEILHIRATSTGNGAAPFNDLRQNREAKTRRECEQTRRTDSTARFMDNPNWSCARACCIWPRPVGFVYFFLCIVYCQRRRGRWARGGYAGFEWDVDLIWVIASNDNKSKDICRAREMVGTMLLGQRV